MRDKTFWAICLASVFLFSSGFVLSCGVLSGCADNNLDEEKAGAQSTQPEDPGVLAASRKPEPSMRKQAPPQRPPYLGAFSGKVLETMNASRYTYLLVDTGDGEVWAAVPECTIEVGDVVKVSKGIPMDRFHSETLDRTFDLIYFCPSLKKQGAREEAGAGSQSHPEIPGRLPQGHPEVTGTTPAPSVADAPAVNFSGLKKAEGGKTIVEIFNDKDNLSGKEVLVRGKVVKYNPRIMGKNWFHLRDGTGVEGTNDLTINTQAEVKVGDTVLVRGKIVLNKDFGFGYQYDVLIEDAVIIKE